MGRASGSAVRESAWILGLASRAAPALVTVLVAATLLQGILPAGIAYLARAIVDRVVSALAGGDAAWRIEAERLLVLVAIEASLAVGLVVAQRAQATVHALLRERLSTVVTQRVLEKAVALELAQLEDPDVHDQLLRARREADRRPFDLVAAHFTLARTVVSLLSCIALLFGLSAWTVAIVILAGLPAFVAELRFSAQAWDAERKRSPEHRQLAYLENLLSREDSAGEIRALELGPIFLERHRRLSQTIERTMRRVMLERGIAGTVLSTVSVAFFYIGYAWIVRRTVNEHLTIGEMTMYLALFRQAQNGVSTLLVTLGAMLDDRTFLADLRALLVLPVPAPGGTATAGPDPDAGLAFEDVEFTYPGGARPALDGVTFRARPGQMLALVGENGSGKSTLIKLALRMYEPSGGRILLDGLDVRAWDRRALRRRFALVFQEFVRLKLLAGENIGAGDAARFSDEAGWRAAAERGLSASFLEALPLGYHTPLGKWYRGGQELSGGQWQKVALSRAFMRTDPRVLVLDEPTSSLDPEAEAVLFSHVREAMQAGGGREVVLLVSHRLGSLGATDHVVMLADGRVIEEGAHADLLARGGRYAQLYALQAAGYRASVAATEPRSLPRPAEP